MSRFPSNFAFGLFLLLSLVSILIWAYLFRTRGFPEADTGMPFVRIVVKKLLLPFFLSSTGFMAGIVGNASYSSLIRSLVLYIGFAVFAGFLHYAVDTTSKSGRPKADI